MPWSLRIGVEIYFKPGEAGRILARFPELLFAPGHNLFLLGVISAVPFVVFAILTRWRYRAGHPEDPAGFFPHKCGIIGAALAVFGITIFIHLAVWIDVFSPGGGSSTAVIAFVFLPFYALALMPVGYLGGWVIGKMLKR